MDPSFLKRERRKVANITKLMSEIEEMWEQGGTVQLTAKEALILSSVETRFARIYSNRGIFLTPQSSSSEYKMRFEYFPETKTITAQFYPPEIDDIVDITDVEIQRITGPEILTPLTSIALIRDNQRIFEAVVNEKKL